MCFRIPTLAAPSNSFTQFFAAVNEKTTVLIIGDGRNNYNRPNDWVLREIRRKAKQLIWLNPESRMTWGMVTAKCRAIAPLSPGRGMPQHQPTLQDRRSDRAVTNEEIVSSKPTAAR